MRKGRVAKDFRRSFIMFDDIFAETDSEIKEIRKNAANLRKELCDLRRVAMEPIDVAEFERKLDSVLISSKRCDEGHRAFIKRLVSL